jgi:hypothetical protein
MPGPVYTPSQVQLMHYQIVVELAGGIFRGVQKGDPSIKLSCLVLFDDAALPKEVRSTMALTPAELTADAVRAAIVAKREAYGPAFEAYAEKASRFVFEQFGKKVAA